MRDEIAAVIGIYIVAIALLAEQVDPDCKQAIARDALETAKEKYFAMSSKEMEAVARMVSAEYKRATA